MSEGLEQTEGKETQPEEQTEEQNTSPPEVNQEQQEAASHGHISIDTWLKSGKSEDDYVGANVFNKQGSLMGQLKSLSKQMASNKHDHEKRMEQNSKLHKQQMEMQISELSAKRDAKIDEADREGAKQYQDTIDGVRANAVPDYQPEPDVVEHDDVINDYNTNNPWLYDNSPKATYAVARFNHYQDVLSKSSGADSARALKMMEHDLKQHYPDVNHRRQEPNKVQSGGGSAQSSSSGLRMDQLTDKELSIYNRFSKTWTKEDFLKSVAEDRRLS